MFKGTLPENIFILKKGHIGHINSQDIGGLKKTFLKIFRNCNFSDFLVPEIMSPLHVRSKFCIAPIHVRSKLADFALHRDGSNADFAPHIEGSHADFAPHMEWRHRFRDQQIVKIANSSNVFLKNF